VENKKLSKKEISFVMVGLMLGLLLSALNSTIVGTAMPKIISELNGLSLYSWVFTAYMLGSTISVIVFGKLSDLLGRKPIFITGIIIFLTGSSLCGISQNIIHLIVFRGFQGIGGGILFSISFIIVGDMFSLKERGKYMGILSSVFAISSVIGPFIGGFITDNLNWRWNFYVNIPFGILALIIIILKMPKFKNHHDKIIIDFPGVITLTSGLFSFFFALTLVSSKTAGLFSLQVIGSFILSIVSIIAFIFIERKAPEPLLPLIVFKNSSFKISALMMFFVNAIMFCVIIYVPLFIQGIKGNSATASGFITAPMMVCMILSSILTGKIMSKIDKYKILGISGFIFMLTGTLILSFININTSEVLIFLSLVFVGTGIGMANPVFNVTGQSGFSKNKLGIVTSTLQFFRNIGGIMGSSLFGFIMATTMKIEITKINLVNASPEIKELINNPRLITNSKLIEQSQAHFHGESLLVFQNLLKSMKLIFSDSIKNIFITGVIISIIALIIVFFMEEISISRENAE
jgi:EmrB/QacA subfamily drug resistance transporter